jgi:hypothetical protein
MVAALPVSAADHLLITEFAVSPTDGEFIEIYNPTADILDLTDYYLSDMIYRGGVYENYWHLTDASIPWDTSFPHDFIARFPSGTSIFPGQAVVVSLHDDGEFQDVWGNQVSPDFEFTNDGDADGVPAMRDPGLELVGHPYILSQAGLSNDREIIILFKWDGVSDLVQDVDIVQWSNAGPDFVTLSADKSGISVDGPDADEEASTYLDDTPPQGQDLASSVSGAHDYGKTVSRIHFGEGDEVAEGGNGLTGNDETSENYSATWLASTVASIGSPGDYGPPAMLSAASTAEDRVELVFSRTVDPVTAGSVSSYTLGRVQSASGVLENVPVTVEAAVPDTDGLTIALQVGTLSPLAVYEVRASGIASEDLTEELVPGSRILFRGFNPGPGLSLIVPKRPFAPDLDGQMDISYEAPQGEVVRLRFYDMRGREVFLLAEETVPAGGLGSIPWDGRDHLRRKLPAGMYLLHLEMTRTGEKTVAPVVVALGSEGTLR